MGVCDVLQFDNTHKRLAVQHLQDPCILKPLYFVLHISQLQQCKQVHILSPCLLRTFACVGYSWKLDLWPYNLSQCACVNWQCSLPHICFALLCFSVTNGLSLAKYTIWNHVSKVAHEQFWLYTGSLTVPTTVAVVLELFSSWLFDTSDAERDSLLLYCTWIVH